MAKGRKKKDKYEEQYIDKKAHHQDKTFIDEYRNLITIFIGIFFLYSLNSKSMGILGTFIQTTFMGFFGKLSMIIPYIIILVGVLSFFEKNEYVYKLKSTKLYYAILFFILLFYGLFNTEYLPIDSPFKADMLKGIFNMSVEGEGSGIFATIITYYVVKMFGVTGAWLMSIFALMIMLMFTFDISLKDIIRTFNSSKSSKPKVKSKSQKTKKANQGASLKEKLLGLKESVVDMITVETDEDEPKKKEGLLSNLFKKDEEEESKEFEGEKTIKIVGFNKAEDDYLEILEGTSSMPELSSLKDDDIKEYKKEEKPKEKQLKILDTNNSSINIDVQTKYENYKKPTIDLLNKSDSKSDDKNKKKVLKNASLLEKTLLDFGVEASVNQVTIGPTITRYEIQPSPGVKVSKIVNLTDDIALSLAAKSIRIEAPIPGKSAIGIEVPNEEPQMVSVRDVFESEEFKKFDSPLAMALCKDIAGKPIIGDIGKMPHLLIAGSTGSGKSVCVNTLINSILYKANPDEVKFLMIDPKVVELANYNGLPHLLIPVVTDPKKASYALNWAVTEMNRRYKLFAENSVKDISSYNEKMEDKFPKIVIIIDELADLMMVGANEVEDAICRLAQMARAAGMHLIVATQRPSVDVITGVIKANIPSRIAFAVSSQTDSRTILDMGGAEKLLGKGDMLFYPLGAPKPVRLQGAFISETEIEHVVDFVKDQCRGEEINYQEDILESITKPISTESEENDELLSEAIEFIVESGQASASMLQRKFRVGFNRAARLIDSIEERGIIGPS
ncbi:MAG TPA: DNA translocase FtsK 4TM domain-containing protein [Peptostreptococcaceae bacterium]|nr:DNA translocase FtsK 4TM domain-containing protein [Peptostreptococcaceae bacterium]